MANNFTFYSPTEIVFGRGAQTQVAAHVQKYGGTKVLVVYGSERVVKNGLLDSIVTPMREAGLTCHLLGGVVPNPHLSKVYEGIEIGKREGIDFLLAVGGGSVIDTAKAIGYGLETIFSGQYQNLTTPGAIALAAAIISIVGKEAMYWYTRHYALLIHSSAFLADAWHHRSDAFSSIGSLIGIAGAMLGFPVLDSVASVVICLFILKVSYDILKDAVNKLLDTSCGEEYEAKLRRYITARPGVEGVDLLHTRMFGNKVYIDLEIEVDGDKTLREAHSVAEAVHTAVEQAFPEVKHVMIHVNPAQASS